MLEMKTTKISKELTPEEKHAAEVDAVRVQCEQCARNKPKTPTKDCDIKRKLIIEDSKVAWKHKHLFLHQDGPCKMFKGK